MKFSPIVPDGCSKSAPGTRAPSEGEGDAVASDEVEGDKDAEGDSWLVWALEADGEAEEESEGVALAVVMVG